MYICNDCGAIFTEPKEVYERHGLDSPPYERFDVCPICYGTNFDECKETGDDE